MYGLINIGKRMSLINWFTSSKEFLIATGYHNEWSAEQNRSRQKIKAFGKNEPFSNVNEENTGTNGYFSLSVDATSFLNQHWYFLKLRNAVNTGIINDII